MCQHDGSRRPPPDGSPKLGETRRRRPRRPHGTNPLRSLNALRIDAVARALTASGARDVLDLGCGAGALLGRLVVERQYRRIVGVDTSAEALNAARQRLLGEPDAGKVALVRTSFAAPDDRLVGFDAAAMVETIEHVEPDALSAVERAVFRCFRPRLLIVTTPNRDYNALYGLRDGQRRHRDHRFEWGRSKFEAWAGGVAARSGYRVAFEGVGEPHPDLGSATQMASFVRTAA